MAMIGTHRNPGKVASYLPPPRLFVQQGLDKGHHIGVALQMRRLFKRPVRLFAHIAQTVSYTHLDVYKRQVLRNGGITSALIGASKPEQITDCVGALARLDFTAAELAAIDAISEEKAINLWARSSEELSLIHI